MVASIPASRIVNITPTVLPAGGTALDLCALLLTTSTRIPVGVVQAFDDAASVGAYFGLSSREYALAVKYFLGFTNSTANPARLLIAQRVASAVAAYIKGGPVGSLTLAELQALNGTLSLTIDGEEVTSGAIDLSTATSFSNAAALINTALAAYDADVTISTTSGSPVIDITALASGQPEIGMVVSAAGIPAGTTITSIPGGGGAGNYGISANATATATGVNAQIGGSTVTYDSTWKAFVITAGEPGAEGSITLPATNSLSTGLALTAATGALISNASDALTPAEQMAAVIGQTQNFASFTNAQQPTTDDDVAFAAWNSAQTNRFVYGQWDNNAALTTTDYAATAWGLIQAASYTATMPFFDPTDPGGMCIAALGGLASIDFNAIDGRMSIALQSQAGLVAGVTSDPIAAQLEANGVNFYGQYATAAQGFDFFYPGAASGAYAWADTLVNEIWMTNAFQLALMTLLTTVKNIPYNDQGKTLIKQSLKGPIGDAVTFGAIQPGVKLSSDQIAAINAATGVDAATTIGLVGWYLQVATASPQVRAARGSPPINFWYTDGGSVQRISMNSAEVQ